MSNESATLLADKYRPLNLDAFQLDKPTHGALRSLITMNCLNILLYGNQSCGKTTLVDVLVHEYYGKNVDPVTQIMHINSLREQGVRFYKSDMKAFCRSVSVIPNKKKLVIIDDIDGVPEQSQQVFRDYIDRYSNNVCFIATCTNLQRVIESIQSRIHILRIRPLPAVQIRLLVDRICTNENIVLDNKAGLCNGSVKAAINGLEKMRLIQYDVGESTTDEFVFDDINVHFVSYLNYLVSGNMQSAIQTLFMLYDTGYSVIDIIDFFYQFIKTTDEVSEDIKYAIIPILCEYIHIFYNLHEAKIELALFTNELAALHALKIETHSNV